MSKKYDPVFTVTIYGLESLNCSAQPAGQALNTVSEAA